ncbi:GNAT family N-acetyltransferase [Donghicola mangrovi]|uniref:GNAT family N-acetyltransferase n=1 Tax=Donghicola mangrovi TaxID=2729614 RepID=A0A850PZ59_9RHOB|nr:N-acetyltransferase [Donghicola mangrovi]NVO22116.1 GNAT family N-acetyltransferase [Donghicola mangrovi]
MLIRPATTDDADAIWAMLEPVFRAGETYAIPTDISREEALEYWMGGTHSAWVAVADIGIVGTGYLCPNHKGNADHICNAGFVTDPQTRGRGVAQGLLNHILAEARMAGYGAMQFNFVVSTNAGAIALWQRNGFEIVGTLPKAFRHPTEGKVDAHVMYQLL